MLKTIATITPHLNLKKPNLLLGVTGSIAAYKAIQIVRDLVAEGASVQTVLTPSALRFIPEITLRILSGRPVFSDLFDPHDDVIHLRLAEAADAILIAPATANFISKMAVGMADTLLGALLLSAHQPILIAPAMDGGMWDHPTVQKNVALLRERGVQIIGPEYGPLASGREGIGRMASEKEIVASVRRVLSRSLALAGEVVLVTAGPTREAIDPVRFISNRSSGKMGYAVAETAWKLGAKVILISGPTALPVPFGVDRICVETAEEMKRAVEEYYGSATMVVLAAAVSDYRPAQFHSNKIKKTGMGVHLELVETKYLLEGMDKGKRLWIGFAAETEHLIQNAQKKRADKKFDLIIANNVLEEGAGFDTETNIGQLIHTTGEVTSLPKLSKKRLAERIMDEAILLKKQQATIEC